MKMVRQRCLVLDPELAWKMAWSLTSTCLRGVAS